MSKLNSTNNIFSFIRTILTLMQGSKVVFFQSEYLSTINAYDEDLVGKKEKCKRREKWVWVFRFSRIIGFTMQGSNYLIFQLNPPLQN